MFPSAIYDVNVRVAQCHLESRSLFLSLGVRSRAISVKLSVQVFNSGCIYNYNHVQKSWDTFAFVRLFFNSHMPNPYPHPTNNVGYVSACIQNFSEFQHCIGWGRENCKKKKSKKMPNVYFIRASEITKNYEYCITALGLLSRSVH